MTPIELRVARLMRHGFTARQARAMAEAGYDVVGYELVDVLLGAAS